jgi:hypothetical protein
LKTTLEQLFTPEVAEVALEEPVVVAEPVVLADKAVLVEAVHTQQIMVLVVAG